MGLSELAPDWPQVGCVLDQLGWGQLEPLHVVYQYCIQVLHDVRM